MPKFLQLPINKFGAHRLFVGSVLHKEPLGLPTLNPAQHCIFRHGFIKVICDRHSGESGGTSFFASSWPPSPSSHFQNHPHFAARRRPSPPPHHHHLSCSQPRRWQLLVFWFSAPHHEAQYFTNIFTNILFYQYLYQYLDCTAYCRTSAFHNTLANFAWSNRNIAGGAELRARNKSLDFVPGRIA